MAAKKKNDEALPEEEVNEQPDESTEEQERPEPEGATKAESEDATEETRSEDVPEPSPQFEDSNSEEETLADPADRIIPTRELLGEGQSPPPPPRPAASVSPQEERTWAMLAHLSILLNLVTGFLGGIGAIIIYFVYKDRSRYIAYHAMQSFLFQTITWLGAGLLAGIFIGVGSAFAILIIPLLCLIPGFVFILVPPASLIYGIIGAVKTNNGEDFRYWQVGDWVRNILEPQPVQKA
jgi:uncharacterized protein